MGAGARRPPLARVEFAAPRDGDDLPALVGRAFNNEQREHDEPTISWGDYLLRPQLWEETLQNRQSEFLAVGTMAVFTIYLRQRGSPESKPVGAPNKERGSSG